MSVSAWSESIGGIASGQGGGSTISFASSRFFTLALDDIRDAARELRAAYEQSRGRDGFISFECTPDLADDTEATISQALELWDRLDEPNIMIRVPRDDGRPRGDRGTHATWRQR
jgi:hypothetical protein